MVEYNHIDETIMVNTVYPESPSEKAGLKVGDFIYAVNGVTVEEIGYLNAVYHIRGEIGTEVEITVIRGAEFVTVTATRAEVEEINVDYNFDEETKLAHISIVSFKSNTYAQFKAAIDEVMAKGARGIVLDLRNNTGGYVQSACDMLSYILPTGYDLVSYQYKGKDKVVIKSYDDGKGGYDHVVDLPITILCNQYSASSSEIFISALRDHRDAGLIDATIVGVNTFGKGIMQSTYGYTDDSTVTITVSYLYPPCGESYHGTGILPEVIVELGEDSDNQLEAAYDELLKLINKQ
jgi:carboxyl-terminal processing protease